MVKTAYEYSVISFNPDRVRNERLNVGVVVLESSERNLWCLLDRESDRLVEAFGDRCDSGHHGRVLDDIEGRCNRIRASPLYRELEPILDRLIPDRGLAYEASAVRYGLSADVEMEAEELFERLVLK